MIPGSDCTCCGKCCMHMRPYITVGNRSTDGRFSCLCVLTGEKFRAMVTGEDLHRIYDRNFQFRYPKACPFLVSGEGDTFSCIIYRDRPGHCRDFSCSRHPA